MSSSSRCADPERRALLSASLGLGLGFTASAHASSTAPPEVAAALPGATLHGSGRLRFFGLAVFDARLWAAGRIATQDWSGQPFALELEYARTLAGRAIAERSIQEMQRQATIPDATVQVWQREMTALFPDVRAGDRLTGLMQPGKGARFHFNGRLRGDLRDHEFARRFFGIWLAPQTSEPDLRARLLGLVERR